MVTTLENQTHDHRGVDALGSGAAVLGHRLAQEIHRGKVRGAEAHGVQALQHHRRLERRIESYPGICD